jgi:hypothetical protein
MSLKQALLNQAEAAYRAKDWKKASNSFETYFKKAYPGSDPEIAVEDAKRLLHYGVSVFHKAQSEGVHNQYDAEELETAVACLLNVRELWRSSRSAGPLTLEDNADTYEVLGQIALLNNQFLRAAGDFRDGYKFACENGLHWRIRLSFLFNVVIALESREKPLQAINAINDCIRLADEELAKAPAPEDARILDEFKRNFAVKLVQLNEDAKEQAENPELRKADRDRDDAEEEEEEEEEAAEEEEQVNQPDKTGRAPGVEEGTKEKEQVNQSDKTGGAPGVEEGTKEKEQVNRSDKTGGAPGVEEGTKEEEQVNQLDKTEGAPGVEEGTKEKEQVNQSDKTGRAPGVEEGTKE